MRSLLIIAVVIMFPFLAHAQVKIGDPTGAVEPKSVLELKDTTRGLLLPRMTTAHMQAISSPPNGLLVYNNTENSIYQFRAVDNLWLPIRSDSSDWYLDNPTGRLYLKHGLRVQDTIYYQTQSKKFIFADTRFYRGTTGNPFNLDEGNSDKHIFKTTASFFPRALPNLNSSNLYSVYEVDNDPVAVANPFTASYTSIASAATISPLATQRVLDLIAFNGFSGNAGQDSVDGMYGISTNTYTRGNNYTSVMMGYANFLSAGGSNTANVGEMYGNYTSMTYLTPGTSTRRILGSIYGNFIGISTSFQNKVDGAAYGLYITTVRGSSSNNNFAIYTSKGANRLGDSTVVTDGAAFKPRAVLDIVSTSAMILPAGNTLQRPSLVYPGMFRYNTQNGSAEVSNGTTWSTIANVINGQATVDPPSITSGTTYTFTVTVTGATTSNTVSISPQGALPSGVIIAYARVSLADTIEIGIANFSGSTVDLPLSVFSVKVIE